MKRALVLVVALAFPLLAEEPKQQPAQPDSPLVAAAKRAKRLGKKPVGPVITNETLRSSGGNAHITTTSTPQGKKMPPVLPAPRPTPEMEAAAARAAREKAAAAEAAKQKAAAAEEQQKAEQAAASAEDGYDGTSEDAAEITGAAAPRPPRF